MTAELEPAENTEPQEDLRQEAPRRLNPIWIFAIIIIAAVAWQWYDTHSQITSLQYELAKRLADADVVGKGTRDLAGEATESGRRLDTKLNLLEAKLAESQSQQLAMEALYQELTRTRDEATLEEVEQLLLIANQQLQLANNVKAALIAMQEADARLQRIDRPQLAPLRKILSKDMDVLSAAPISIPWGSACVSIILPLRWIRCPLRWNFVPGTRYFSASSASNGRYMAQICA